ncbi:tumor necrosis factor receptor superfamily member 13C-like [Centroberyx affinis]|uniref:tumor necrosis factor receptor superfamily member 13C-like n=1 Tax=Centroberyx affinis TaxID=166261 RepID=UPI003A5C62E4
MARKICPPGTTWDKLLLTCMPPMPPKVTRPQPKPTAAPPPAVVVQLRATAPAAQVDPLLVLSPALWVLSALLAVGSILALVLWSIIYRRQTRHSRAAGDLDPGVEPLAKPEPPVTIPSAPLERNVQAEMLQRAAQAPFACSHLDVGAQTSPRWEEGFTACRGPAKHSGMEGGGGLVAYSTAREHRIPLPATELGGTALVTTKTV